MVFMEADTHASFSPSPPVAISMSVVWWPVGGDPAVRGNIKAGSGGCGKGRLAGEDGTPLAYMWMGLLNPALDEGMKTM